MEIVPRAREIAAAYCSTMPHLGVKCAWYHGFWLYMRAMGIAKSSGGQAEFFGSTLRELARGGDWPRVLVSGSADYSMLGLVQQAYEQEGAPHDLTVNDVCETPLFLNRWYAERQGFGVRTVCADILDLETDIPFDVAMTNSFLGFFDAKQRPALFASWARILRRDGKLIFTNRIRPGAQALNRFGPDEIETFCRTAQDEASKLPSPLGDDIEWIVSAARAYAERFFSYPVPDTDGIVELLDHAGFRVDTLDLTGHGGREGSSVSGPTTNQRASYARVIATRM